MEDDLLDVFIQEAQEHLDVLEPALLSLENDPANDGTINEIFRAVHSIKGASGFFGLDRISELAHIMENLMSQVREHVFSITPSMVEALLKGTDKLRVMIDDSAHSNDMDTAVEIAAVKAILDAEGDPTPQALDSIDEETEVKSVDGFVPDPYLLMNCLRHGQNFFIVSLNLIKDIAERGRQPYNFFQEVEDCGEFIDSRTDISGIGGFDDVAQADPMFSFFFSTAMAPELAVEIFDVDPGRVRQIDSQLIKEYIEAVTKNSPASEREDGEESDEHSTAEDTPNAEDAEVVDEAEPVNVDGLKDVTNPPFAPREDATPSKANESKKQPVAETSNTAAGAPVPVTQAIKKDETIRVSVNVLDDLMNLAGEMVLIRNQLVRLSESLAATHPELNSAVNTISYITSDLQEKVMQTRLQPVGMLFRKFTRIIRDLSQKLNKEIHLEISGEDVELDKSILEGLSDPLTHMIRNCADHGIESPEKRRDAGKDPAGHVYLKASHVGDKVMIEIIDDGAGIDPDRIKAKAVEKGVITEAEAADMHSQQAALLVFAPGFSTAEAVSDVSGRGVGMDVVKTNIEHLGGSVDLHSTPGTGTRFALTLPLTLAIVPSMIISVDGQRYALPQVNLEEIVQITEDRQIEYIHGSPVLRLRGRLLPVVSLKQVFDTDCSEQLKLRETSSYIPDRGYLVVLKVEKLHFGLVVEKIHDSEEIVVKPLSGHMKGANCYSGSTIMGDGSVAMILDVQAMASIGNVQSEELYEEPEEEENVDDEAIQQILTFRNHPNERFAIALPFVSRIERVKKEQIEKIGDNTFIKYRDSSMRTVRLEDFINITPHIDECDEYTVIIPKLVCKPIGILVAEVEDAISTQVKLEQGTIDTEGALGTAIIDNEMTLFVDVYNLLERADPVACAFSKANIDLSKLKLLLAEDTHFFQAVVGNYLKEFTSDVTIVKNGQEAFEKLEEEDFDMLITDIEMPVMNGFELTNKVRRKGRRPDIPIIALTALSGKDNREHGLDMGVDSYQVKLDKENLKEGIVQLVTQKLAHKFNEPSLAGS